METLKNAVFWVGLVQCPALYHMVNWASRGLGATEVALFRPAIAIIAGAAILALPLWALGQLPMHGDAASRAWFFGLLFGVVPLAVIQGIRRMRRQDEDAPATATGRCPYCGRFPGYWNILTRPAQNPFPCAACGKRVTTDPARAITLVAVIFVPLAIYVVGWDPPEHVSEWVIWAVGTLFLAVYPLIAKVEAAGG